MKTRKYIRFGKKHDQNHSAFKHFPNFIKQKTKIDLVSSC